MRIMPGFCNVSAAASAAAIAALADSTYNEDVVARIVRDREALAERLREIPGVLPLPSATNFLLVRLPVADGLPVVHELARRGVHVRHFGNPAFGIQDCLRVSVGTPDDNAIFADELEAVLASSGSRP
jgi:histidinol-phosphate aminotransferase